MKPTCPLHSWNPSSCMPSDLPKYQRVTDRVQGWYMLIKARCTRQKASGHVSVVCKQRCQGGTAKEEKIDIGSLIVSPLQVFTGLIVPWLPIGSLTGWRSDTQSLQFLHANAAAGWSLCYLSRAHTARDCLVREPTLSDLKSLITPLYVNIAAHAGATQALS